MSESIKQRLEQYPDISFIDNKTFEMFLAELLHAYQKKYAELTGEEAELAASDPIRLILYSCSALLYQGIQQIDRAGKMGVLKYSTGEFLDNLGAMKNVQRMPAQPSVTTVRFYLSAVRSTDMSITKGTRVKGGDLFFATTDNVKILAGESYADISAACLTPGKAGNEFLPGEISTLVDPINYIDRVENIEKPSGGTDEESDEALAERIYLSPSAYSTAGPEDSYRYWVKTYSTAIQDCKIYSESPGEVDIYVMLQGGELPAQAFLDGLRSYLEADNRRPLTDKVVVKPPEKEEYEIDVTYYISSSDRNIEGTIKRQAEIACQNYVEWQKMAIARDINPSRLMYELMRAGVKWAEIRNPVFARIEGAKVAIPANINLLYGGTQDD